MIDEIEKVRLNQLERCIPDVWDYEKYLYIGAGEYRHHFFETMEKHSINVDICEIDIKNCSWIIENHPWVNSVIHEDIRNYVKKINPHILELEVGKHKVNEKDIPEYDVIIWSHGIETVPKNAESGMLIAFLEQSARKLVIHMTPFGNAGGTGNVSVWYPYDFRNLFYKFNMLGNRDEKNSNLLAWKYLTVFNHSSIR